MAASFVRYPDIVVQMVGEDGNAFAILARCKTAMRRAGLEKSAIDEFINEAKKGDYDHLLRTVMRYFTVE